jgi:hypothetical protein
LGLSVAGRAEEGSQPLSTNFDYLQRGGLGLLAEDFQNHNRVISDVVNNPPRLFPIGNPQLLACVPIPGIGLDWGKPSISPR